MRIPSQFNEDNLYRRENRRSNQGDTRKILHLIVALAFVLLMMQQASRPEIYQSFMGALGMQDDSAHQPSITAAAESSDGPMRIAPAIAAKVADGAVWRRGDFAALFWCLNQSRTVTSVHPPRVNTVSLLQQPDVFRNRRVRVVGKVVRSQPIEAAVNSQGISNYWQVWIQPSDGANRPIVVIAEEVPTEVANVGPDTTNLNGPKIDAEGFFLKRLAYQSSSGADLAPVIVGRMTNNKAAGGHDMAVASETKSGDWKLVAIIVSATAIAGVLFPALIFYRAAISARRIRDIRRRRTGAPDLSFESIGNVSSSDGHDS